jgi:hypothetical protein
MGQLVSQKLLRGSRLTFMNTWSLIDKITVALGEFLDAVKQIKS